MLDRLLDHLNNEVFCELKPSPGKGVGVFAIRPIPSGTRLFPELRDSERIIPKCEVDRLPEGVQTLVRRFGVEKDGNVHIYETDFNTPSLGYFINHSEEPNCELVTDDVWDYVEVIRDIAVGEELFHDYRTQDADYTLKGGEN